MNHVQNKLGHQAFLNPSGNTTPRKSQTQKMKTKEAKFIVEGKSSDI